MQIQIVVSVLLVTAGMPQMLVLVAVHVAQHPTKPMLETRNARRVPQGQALQTETQMPQAQTLVCAE